MASTGLKATMSPRIKADPGRVLSHTLQTLSQGSRPRHSMHGISNLSTASQDDDLSSQDRFSLSSNMQQGNQTPHGMEGWAMTSSGSIDSTDMTSSEPESPEVQMLSFSLSQQLMPTTSHGDSTGSGAMYPSLSDFRTVQDVTDSDMDFTQAQDFHQFSSMVDFYDHDTCASSGTQGCTPDDAASVGHSSQNDDAQMISASDAWNSLAMDTGNFHGSTLDQLSSHIFHPVPVSPPLTEASNDMSVTSSCSNSGYSFHGHDDAFFGDLTTTTIGGQTISLGDPLFPLTPPLSEQDPNRLDIYSYLAANEVLTRSLLRTIRPSKQAQRPLLSAATSRNQRKSDPEFYASLSVREPLRQRSKDGSEIRAPRDHPYYSLPTQADGKYYCPFATGEKPCNHPPTTQKCAYQ